MDSDSDDDDRWEPDLYRVPHPFTRVRIGNAMDMLRLYPYLCACIEDPTVAASLETLVLRNETWREYNGAEERTLFHDEKTALREREAIHEALLRHVRRLGLTLNSAEYVIAALQNRRNTILGLEPHAKSHGPFAEAAAVVLLSLCPNIKTIHIDTASDEGVLGEYLLMNNHNHLPSQSLQHLSSVICCPDSTSYTLHSSGAYADVGVADIARSFHRLPSLRSLSFIGVMLENGGSDRTFLAPGSGTFTHLSLEHVDLTIPQAGSLIRAASGLESLFISLGDMVQLIGFSVSLTPKTLGKCILQHRRTLRILDLDIKASMVNTPEEERDIVEGADDKDMREFDRWFLLEEAASSGPPLFEPMPNTRWYGGGIGSLHDFEALTRLSIQPAKLIGGVEEMWDAEAASGFPGRPRFVDMLPPSLEYLRFHGYKRGKSAWLDEHIDELMHQKAEKLPKLTEVVGCGDEDGEQDSEEDEASDDDREWEWDEDDERIWHRPRQALGWVEIESGAPDALNQAMR